MADDREDDRDARRPGDRDTGWEEQVLEAVGRVIDFWGFKRNHGRVWALLYVRGRPHTAAELRDALDLSKGAVSMMTGDLVDNDVIRRIEGENRRAVEFEAKSDFLSMIRGVLGDREMALVAEVRDDLRRARRHAEQAGVDVETRDRIRRMHRLADIVYCALDLFLGSARLDVAEADDVL
ncbi:MAG: GbsR/MarR family transcriptional regulator [Bradymonadaceae bacterium]